MQIASCRPAFFLKYSISTHLILYDCSFYDVALSELYLFVLNDK